MRTGRQIKSTYTGVQSRAEGGFADLATRLGILQPDWHRFPGPRTWNALMGGLEQTFVAISMMSAAQRRALFLELKGVGPSTADYMEARFGAWVLIKAFPAFAEKTGRRVFAGRRVLDRGDDE